MKPNCGLNQAALFADQVEVIVRLTITEDVVEKANWWLIVIIFILGMLSGAILIPKDCDFKDYGLTTEEAKRVIKNLKILTGD